MARRRASLTMEDGLGGDPVRKGLAMRFETTPDVVPHGEDRAWVLGNMGVSERLLTGPTKDGQRLAVRGCDHYEFPDGRAVRKGSYWTIFE